MNALSTREILFKLLRYGQSYLVYPSGFLPRPRYVNSSSWLFVKDRSVTEITTADNVVLRCFTISRARQDIPSLAVYNGPEAYDGPDLATVIMFHGNGMTCDDLVTVARGFIVLGCNVLMVSYRGYAGSDGVPSEGGLRRDAQAALDHVRGDAELSKHPIILYGLSLGGAVAIDLASRNPSQISALIVENTFESLPRVVRGLPTIGPFSFLCTQRWNSASKIPRIPASTPILMMSGASDRIVPKTHMETLWQISQRRRGTNPASGKDKFASFPTGHHADTFTCPGYWAKVREFMISVTLPSANEAQVPSP
ncbi:Alpha/Beta hydrolase protein [Mycena vulgaris]|nr:Alpha/Beta hydrolase protein [Mycena vulgaris]